ncbi:unnamed protein product [Gordionus sp. m RMFG-2023]|uniref:NADH dehydrogenase [ubiquinone] 1 beta subcomplex subunit 10-like n=1 Tax=Gordionus sp. m RMFG-2023 TaxID=3053472 RepID=UPI0030DFE3B7
MDRSEVELLKPETGSQMYKAWQGFMLKYIYLPAKNLNTWIISHRNPPVYYHRKFNRVKDVDQCYTDDFPCYYEANLQFLRDREIDSAIINILRRRRDYCNFYFGREALHKCEKVIKDFDEAYMNYFVKYGDLGQKITARYCFMKQKHRMIWERRNKKLLKDGSPLSTAENDNFTNYQ